MTKTASFTGQTQLSHLRYAELTEKIRSELKRICGDGATYGAYLSTECGGKIIRGPHITVTFLTAMAPQTFNVKELLNMFNTYYCDVTWDGNIWHGEVGGTVVHPGESTQIVFDIVNEEKQKEEAQECLLSATT
jgi:hypothetical protein